MLLLASLLGCGAPPCGTLPEAERLGCVESRCAAGSAGDLCRVESAGDLAQAADLLRLARAIQDPILRDTAILRWTRDREASMRGPEALALCDALTESERSACLRRLSTPHLQR